MNPRGTGTGLIAQIRALFAADWRGRAGERVRKTIDAISDSLRQTGIEPQGLAKQAVGLAVDKVEGLAQKEKAAAVRDFSEAEERRIDAKLKERSLESRVRREEAETRLAEIKVIDAEMQLYLKLKEAGVVLRRDDNGNYTVLPLPLNYDLEAIGRERTLAEKQNILSDAS